jgi:hypothetical protein
MKKSNNISKNQKNLHESNHVQTNDDEEEDYSYFTCESCISDVIVKYGLFSTNESFHKSLEMKHSIEYKGQKPENL